MSNINKFKSLHEFGFSVFPVKKGDKKPAIKWTGYQQSQPTGDEISFWDSGDFNVGVVCGKVSNLIVIDIDSDEAQVAYEALEPPTTPCVRTAKGRHYYYRFPDSELRNRVRVGEVALDVRGEGGYVVGPGSLHESGITYEWEVSPAERQFADLTPKMLAAFGTSSAKSLALTGGEMRSPSDISGRFGLWLADQLEEAASYLARAKEGTRNDTLNNAAFYLARHVAAAQADWTPFADRLQDAALRVGLGEMEAVRTIESAWEAGRLGPVEIQDSQRG